MECMAKRHVLLLYLVKMSTGQPDNLGHSKGPCLGTGSAVNELCILGQVNSVLCDLVSFSVKYLGDAKSNQTHLQMCGQDTDDAYGNKNTLKNIESLSEKVIPFHSLPVLLIRSRKRSWFGTLVSLTPL